jgi:hypothetical protein
MMPDMQFRESLHPKALHPRHDFSHGIYSSTDRHIAAYLLPALFSKHLNSTADTPTSARNMSDKLAIPNVVKNATRDSQVGLGVHVRYDSFVIVRGKRYVDIQNPYKIMLKMPHQFIACINRPGLGTEVTLFAPSDPVQSNKGIEIGIPLNYIVRTVCGSIAHNEPLSGDVGLGCYGSNRPLDKSLFIASR